MRTRRMDSREGVFRPVPISYLIQTANQFACEIYVTSDTQTANVKHYDEVKNLRLCGPLTFSFRGADEREAEYRIKEILWQ